MRPKEKANRLRGRRDLRPPPHASRAAQSRSAPAGRRSLRSAADDGCHRGPMRLGRSTVRHAGPRSGLSRGDGIDVTRQIHDAGSSTPASTVACRSSSSPTTGARLRSADFSVLTTTSASRSPKETAAADRDSPASLARPPWRTGHGRRARRRPHTPRRGSSHSVAAREQCGWWSRWTPSTPHRAGTTPVVREGRRREGGRP